MTDQKTTISELKQKVLEFRKKRGWTGMENPKDAALSLVLEAAELLEHFQWKTGAEVMREARLYGPVCDELADVIWWVLVVADSMKIDVSKAFEKKLAKNKEKWPEHLFSKEKTLEERDRAYYWIKAKHRGGHPLAEGESEE